MWLTLVWATFLALLKGAWAAGSIKQHAFLHRTGSKKGLFPREGMIFRILQVADAHFGEDPDGSYGPEQDKKSTKVIEAVLDKEKPDLVIFSGDEVTGDGLQGLSQIQKYWGRVVKPLTDRDIQWSTVLGNHDVCQTVGCQHVVQNLDKPTNVAFSQVAALSNRVNSSSNRKEVPSAAEKLAEKRQKEDEKREAEKEGLKKEKEAEERLAKIMKKGVRDIYPDRVKEEQKEEEVEAEAEAEQKPDEDAEYDYTPSESAAEPSVEAVPDGAQVPSEEKKEPADELGAMPDREPRPFVGVQPDPEHPPMQLNSVPDHAKAREQLLKYDTSYTNSWTAREGIFVSEGGGVSNYYLRLFKSEQYAVQDNPSAVLWFLDTGGGDMPETIKDDQVDWLQTASAALKQKYGPLPGILYMHIPSKDFLYVDAQDKSCFGFEEDYITPVVENEGLAALLAAAEIDWLMVAHDHGNDFCCPVQVKGNEPPFPSRLVHLCFGRHTGWGGYSTAGMKSRGARVLEIDLSMAVPGMKSWVRLESGKVAGSSPPAPKPSSM